MENTIQKSKGVPKWWADKFSGPFTECTAETCKTCVGSWHRISHQRSEIRMEFKSAIHQLICGQLSLQKQLRIHWAGTTCRKSDSKPFWAQPERHRATGLWGRITCRKPAGGCHFNSIFKKMFACCDAAPPLHTHVPKCFDELFSLTCEWKDVARASVVTTSQC